MLPLATTSLLFLGLALTPLQDASENELAQIDRAQGAHELLKIRNPQKFADERLASPTTFGQSITDAIRAGLRESHPDLGGIEQDLGFPSRIKPTSVSLISNAMCEVDATSLAHNIRKVPSSKGISAAARWAKAYNQARDQALSADTREARAEGVVEVTRLYSRLMGCLAYTESLGAPDSKSSQRVAAKYAPADYTRPEGVDFYYDLAQDAEESRLNIGLYQFAPDPKGNIASCVKAWNQAHPSQTVPARASSDDMIRLLGSSTQRFNAFCGVNKLVQLFYVQANTQHEKRTQPGNIGIEPSQRCVSLHMRKAYNHFGPLQNSTGRNFEELMSCAMADPRSP